MSHPQYEAVPLAREEISLCVVQSRVRAVDARNRDASLGENLAHMLGLIDAANGWLGPKNLVMFHEFPLTGFDARWSREELLKVAIEIPGPETEAIAARARSFAEREPSRK